VKNAVCSLKTFIKEKPVLSWVLPDFGAPFLVYRAKNTKVKNSNFGIEKRQV